MVFNPKISTDLTEGGPGRLRSVLLPTVLGCIVSAVPALKGIAAPWYVDNAAVASANTGTDWANAWTNFTSIVWGANGVKAGDTLYISGGTTSKIYTNIWSVGASGTPSNPIRIAIDADNPEHNGVAIFDYDYAGDLAEIDGIHCFRDYITFDGNVNGECHLAIINLRNTLEGFSVFGIVADATKGFVIERVAFTNCNGPIRLIYAEDFKVGHCQLRQVRGDAAITAVATPGKWDTSQIYSNYFEMLFGTNTPPNSPEPYFGPDGIQCGDGITIFGNTFREVLTTNYTSSQHPDFIQSVGNFTKIHGNEFINVGDSAVDYGLYSDPVVNGVWIYNNVFRIEQVIDPFPEFIRIYNGDLVQMNDVKILNNTFVDNTNWISITLANYGSPTGTGNEIKNNIFYDCGGGPFRPLIYFEDGCGFDSDSWEFDGNVYYHPKEESYVYFGNSYSASVWVNNFEPKGTTSQPLFVQYAAFGTNNDLRLQPGDVAAVDAGVDLSDWFDTDRDGTIRPAGPGWDIGAYEVPGGGYAFTNLPPEISPITQDVPDADSSAAGLQVLRNTAVQYSASASDPEENPLAWHWSYTVNTGPEVIHQSGTGPVATVNFNYPSGSSGSTYIWKLRVSDGQKSSQSLLALDVIAAPRSPQPLVFEAEAGEVTDPFVITNGYIYQPVQTTADTGGRAAYPFVITNAGKYSVQALVDAPRIGEQSFYVNIDAEPQESVMLWHIPVTVGVQNRVVTWQGNGSCTSPQFEPKTFFLDLGPHELIVRGKDANARLDQFSLVPLPKAKTLGVTDLTFNRATIHGRVNPSGLPTTARFQYGTTTNYGKTTPNRNVGSGNADVTVSNVLSGLAANTTYHYRLVATNRGGPVYGEDLTFTTTPAPAYAANQFTVWTATSPGRVYYLEYILALGNTNWTAVTNVPGNGLVLPLTDNDALPPQRFYRVRGVALPEVETWPATDLTADRVILNGAVNPLGTEAMAFFEHGVTLSYGSVTPPIAVGNGISLVAVSNEVTGLNLHSPYHYRLVAYNSGGTNSGNDQIIAVPAPLVLAPDYQAEQFSISVLSVAGFTYYLEFKTNLNEPEWTTLPGVPGTGALLPLVAPDATNSQCFYRVRVE